MSVIKNNIIPQSDLIHGRFMPHKGIERVCIGKDQMTPDSQGASYNFSKGFFVPDSLRAEDIKGSQIVRVGCVINDYNTAAESISVTVSAMSVYGVELEGETLTANALVGGDYCIAASARTNSGGTEPNKYGIFFQMYNIGGVISESIDGTGDGTLYIQSDVWTYPDNFHIKTINPMAYMIYELVFTAGATEEAHQLDIIGFVDFQNLKD